MALIRDFLRALGQCTDPRFVFVILKALGLTVALLIGVATLAAWSITLLPDPLFSVPLLGEVARPSLGLGGVAFAATLWASSFLMIPVAAIFVGLFLEDVASAVEARHYPGLTPRRIGLVQSLTGALAFLALVIGINLVALIPYLLFIWLPPVTMILFYAVNGYLLGREYFQMVAERHLPRPQATALRRRHRGRIWLAGVLMAIPLTIPVLNLLVPVFGVATITHQFHRLRHG